MSSDLKEEKKPKMNTLMLMSSKGVIGGVSGYMLGRFTKQITDIAIFYAGLTVLLVGGLNWMHWITINWSEIDEDLLHIYDRAKTVAKDKGLFAKFKRFILRTAPLMIGFGTGFHLAFSG